MNEHNAQAWCSLQLSCAQIWENHTFTSCLTVNPRNPTVNAAHTVNFSIYAVYSLCILISFFVSGKGKRDSGKVYFPFNAMRKLWIYLSQTAKIIVSFTELKFSKEASQWCSKLLTSDMQKTNMEWSIHALILDLASQLHKNLHFNHFQSQFWVMSICRVKGWKKATSLEPSAEDSLSAQAEAPAQVTI